MRRTFVTTLEILFFVFLLPVFALLMPYCFIRRMLKKVCGLKPTLLWAPLPIINIAYNRSANRALGYRSDCLVYGPYHITQREQFDYSLERYIHLPYAWVLVPFFTMLWAALKYDILHFFYDGGFIQNNRFLHGPELMLWRALGKSIVVLAYGRDVRQESTTRALGAYHVFMDLTHDEVEKNSGQSEQQIRAQVRRSLRWASAALSMGDMTEYTPGSRNDLFYWAIDTRRWQPHYPVPKSQVTIVHAPNHPLLKGTRFLLDAVQRLQRDGYPVRLQLVQRMSNDEARHIYETADIIAEQFIAGWHGFFAIEAMALGKPVLCYIRKRSYLPSDADCPIVNTNPERLYNDLLRLVRDPELRVKLGRRGRAFVEQVYSLERVGARFDALYKKLW